MLLPNILGLYNTIAEMAEKKNHIIWKQQIVVGQYSHQTCNDVFVRVKVFGGIAAKM